MNPFVFVSSLFESWAKLLHHTEPSYYVQRETWRVVMKALGGCWSLEPTERWEFALYKRFKEYREVQMADFLGRWLQQVKALLCYANYNNFTETPNLYAHGTRARF